VIALKNPYQEGVRIAAPWGTPETPAYQEGSAKCFLVISLDEAGNFTNDRYLIGDAELLRANYKPVFNPEVLRKVEEIISGLLQKGYTFVYINLATGKYGGEKNLADFPFGYRDDCYCLDPDKDLDHFSKTKEELAEDMAQCLAEGIRLQDIK
jgi:hypothetical protein